jgi:hypothetical protein
MGPAVLDDAPVEILTTHSGHPQVTQDHVVAVPRKQFEGFPPIYGEVGGLAKKRQLGPVGLQNGAVGAHQMERDRPVFEEVLEIKLG